MTPQIEFSKWQGIGNDYIIVAANDLAFEITPPRAAAICDRHFGIGSDGILLWSGTESSGFSLVIYNPDGTMAEMCGNGIRMLARYLVDRGYATEPVLAVDTGAGMMAPSVSPDGQVRVKMGVARFGGGGIVGFTGKDNGSEAVCKILEACGREFEFTFVDMGNPHCVIEVDDLADIDLELVGSTIENHEIFPNRTNVEFMKVVGPSEVEMRVWARGVGETNACGTGACAVAVTACRSQGITSPITVHLPGGDLMIEVDLKMNVVMTGPAEEVYSGTMSEDLINRIKEL
ncbi:MAG: diaminopimelate epimerase [Thermoleophilia bacterium]|nr:diaminopimelate epimerase [Thermoleophilia bacterium]